jgi:hypothetical protein
LPYYPSNSKASDFKLITNIALSDHTPTNGFLRLQASIPPIVSRSSKSSFVLFFLVASKIGFNTYLSNRALLLINLTSVVCRISLVLGQKPSMTGVCLL